MMNERDIRLMETIFHQIGKNLFEKCRVLFVADYVHIAKINLLLLKGLLDVRRLHGIFIVVDRPYQYMAALLKAHGIDQHNLTYVDMITNLSRIVFCEGETVKFTNGPFQVDLISDAFLVGYSSSQIQKPIIDLTEIDFALVDNIATMLAYNPLSRVETFIKNFLTGLQRQKPIFTSLIIDSGVHTDLYRIAKKFCDREINIKEEMMG